MYVWFHLYYITIDMCSCTRESDHKPKQQKTERATTYHSFRIRWIPYFSTKLWIICFGEINWPNREAKINKQHIRRLATSITLSISRVFDPFSSNRHRRCRNCCDDEEEGKFIAVDSSVLLATIVCYALYASIILSSRIHHDHVAKK